MPQLIIKTDAPKKGWGAVCQGITTGGTWSYQEKKKHIKVLELIAVRFAILNFTREKIGNKNPLTNKQYSSSVLLGKNGETHSQELLQVAKEIWDYLLAN